MTIHYWADVKKRKLSPARVARVERKVREEILEMNLRAVRDLVGRTQVEVAKLAGMDQSEVSKAERRDDHLLSTLRRYIEALGGELEVVARFGNKTVRLKGV